MKHYGEGRKLKKLYMMNRKLNFYTARIFKDLIIWKPAINPYFYAINNYK